MKSVLWQLIRGAKLEDSGERIGKYDEQQIGFFLPSLLRDTQHSIRK